MNGTILDSTEVEKDLGVHVDNKLNFDHHIAESVKKANKILGMLSRFIINKDKSIMVPLFKSLVRPILEYGNVIWNPPLKRNINSVEKVQQRFTKRIVGMDKASYEERLKILKLPSLEYRRLRGDMIETYKILHELYDTASISSLLKINNTNTRGHPLKLTKKICEN